MIKVNQKPLEPSHLNHILSTEIKIKIAELMGRSTKVYEYKTFEQLDFELEMRHQIIEAAILLNKSGAEFSSFSFSKCNDQYWRRTQKGAFALKPTVQPHDAINDIFLDGKKYAFECATAIVIIFYKAVLESIEKEDFNRLFSDLYLYDWHTDKDLGIRIHIGTDYLPGDCVYFNNPDVNPETPEWKGENTIVLDDNLYYGHPLGIWNSQVIIDFLNTKRKDNPSRSTFLMDEITRPNFRYLSRFRLNREAWEGIQDSGHSSSLIISEIGSKTYLF